MEIIDDLDLLVDLATDQLVHQVLLRVARIERRQEHIVGALSDLQAADASLQTEVAAVLGDVTDLQAKIADLTGQLGQGVSPADLQPVIDDVNAQAQRIKDALTPAAAEPAPTDQPAEPAPAPEQPA